MKSKSLPRRPIGKAVGELSPRFLWERGTISKPNQGNLRNDVTIRREVEHSVRLRLFGDLEVSSPEASVRKFPARKCRSLLILLAVSRHRRKSRQEIIAELWPDSDETSARKALSQTQFFIKKTLEDSGISILNADAQELWLCPDLGLDFEEFDSLIKQAETKERIQTLRQALDLIDGPFGGHDAEDIFLATRQDYENRVLAARAWLAETYIEQGKPTEALEQANQCLAVDPLHERACFAACVALLALGQKSAAKRLYDGLTEGLNDQLGVQPSVPWEDFEKPSTTSLPRTKPQPRAGAHRPLALIALFLVLAFAVTSAMIFRGRTTSPSALDFNTAHGRLAAIADKGQVATVDEERERITLCRKLLKEAWSAEYGAGEDEWATRIELLLPHFRNAMNWSLKHDPEAAVEMSGILWRYMEISDKSAEAAVWLKSALALTKNQTYDSRGRACAALAFQISETNPQEAMEWSNEANRIYTQLSDRWGIAHAMRSRGFILAAKTDIVGGRAAYLESLHQFEEIGDLKGQAVARLCYGFTFNGNGHDAATTPTEVAAWWLDTALMYQKLENTWGIGMCLRQMPRYTVALGNGTREQELKRRLLNLYESRIGKLALNGSWEDVVTYRIQSFDLASDLGDKKIAAAELSWFAASCATHVYKQPVLGLQFAGKVQELDKELGLSLFNQSWVDFYRMENTPNREELLAKGRSLSLDQLKVLIAKSYFPAR